MWVHILIFALVGVLALGWKMGWIYLEGLDHEQGKKLFLLVVLVGNLVGMSVTLTTKQETPDIRLEKGDAFYEQRFQVSVEEERNGEVSLQVPQKYTEETGQKESENEEPWQQRLRQAVVDYNREKGDPDYYYLPEEWEGKKLRWEYPRDHSGTLLAALSVFAAAMVMIWKLREEEEKRAKRYEELLMDYPGLIMEFTLLIQAGMTVRKVFQKIAMDYRRKEKKRKRAAYEEILITCYEMESGISEAEAYRRFGERCGQIKYKTFATLLIQNLQKGSRHLADLLEAESMEAWEERKRRARILGEAASTKLLLPMVMMLAVVMALIMIPAFLSFLG